MSTPKKELRALSEATERRLSTFVYSDNQVYVVMYPDYDNLYVGIHLAQNISQLFWQMDMHGTPRDAVYLTIEGLMYLGLDEYYWSIGLTYKKKLVDKRLSPDFGKDDEYDDDVGDDIINVRETLRDEEDMATHEIFKHAKDFHTFPCDIGDILALEAAGEV
jgi:hypothetical protein